jgi:hypothetical protein
MHGRKGMSYHQYTDPEGGYSKPAGGYKVDPGKGYAPAAVKTYQAVTPAPLEPFNELNTIFDGLGDFHVNHFIGYFQLPITKENHPRNLTSQFRRRFCNIFSADNIASAKLGGAKKKFKGLDTVEFIIGGNLGPLVEQVTGFVHSDWVSMQMDKDGNSFYGTTLKRNWLEKGEIVFLLASLTSILNIVNPVTAVFALAKHAAASRLIETNQYHFLAGRRSWRVGYDDRRQMYYVDTAALERSSRVEYAAMEITDILRDDIIALWSHLVTNYVADIESELIKMPLEPKYEFFELDGKIINVAHRMGSYEKIEDALKEPWFAKVLKGHPGLVRNINER